MIKNLLQQGQTDEYLLLFLRMKKYIEDVINDCTECILVNKAEGSLYPIPKDDIPIILTSLNSCQQQTRIINNHIFTVIKAFRKILRLYLVKNTSSHNAIQKLKQ